MTRMLVTGGAGMLGSAIASHFATSGGAVVATQRAATGSLEAVEWITADLTERHALDDVGPFDVIVHAAAEIPHSHADSAAVATANRAIDECILATAARWEA